MTSQIMVPLTEDQLAIVEMLKETLAQALEGSFTTIGLAVCMKEGFSHAMAGHDAGSLNLACDDLKREILARVNTATKERQTRRSSLLQMRQ